MFFPWTTIILICQLVFNALLPTSASTNRGLVPLTWQEETFLWYLIPFPCWAPFDVQHLPCRLTLVILRCMVGTGYNRSQKRKGTRNLNMCPRGWRKWNGLGTREELHESKELTRSFRVGHRLVAFSMRTSNLLDKNHPQNSRAQLGDRHLVVVFHFCAWEGAKF